MNVDELVTELHAQRTRLQERLRTIDVVLEGLEQILTLDAEPPPAKTPRRTTSPTPPAGGSGFRCDECGKRFNRPNGLSRHLNQTHGVTTAGRRRPRAPRAAGAPDEPVDPALVLRCGQCGWDVALRDGAADQLFAHCRAMHDRSPSTLERRPRPRRDFASPLSAGHVNGAPPEVITT